MMEFLKRNKLPALIVLAAIAVVAVVVLVVLNAGPGGPAVYVQRVGDLQSDAGLSIGRYAGIVESQKTEKIKFDASKTLGEIAVEAGQKVSQGDVLFTYNTQVMQLDVEAGQLEIDSLQATVTTNSDQIKQLQSERNSVEGADRLAYDAQIQQLQSEINSTNYQIKTKQAEIERLKKEIETAAVTSPVTGVVESVADPMNPDPNAPDVLVTVRNGGDLRVKGSVSEQNISNVYTGQSVIVRSRVDADKTWKGTIGAIDTGSAEANGDAMSGEDGANRASFYTFYVELESSEKLIMGQHVVIEPDVGQSVDKSGIWIPSSFIQQEGDTYFVWARNSRGRLQKQTVAVQRYDEGMDEYEITSGLTLEDYIAWPDENCVTGAKTTTEYVWNEDEEELLQAAREACLRKVVIKRPLKGPYLGGVKPSHSLRGKVVRYDVVGGFA
jgi:HlyD family secretion protein